jgi:hypothetical protein
MRHAARDAEPVQPDELSYDLAGEPEIRTADLLRAVGIRAARRARADLLEPLEATVTAVWRLGASFVTDTERHPRVAALTARGEAARTEVEQSARENVRRLLRWSVERVLAALDLTQLVLVHVDLDELAAGIDVDAVVARTDLDAAVGALDLDGLLARIDLDALLQRIDLDELASRVDLDSIVSHVDLDAVLRRVDLDALASRIDVGALVSQVDPDAVVARVDLDAVLGRLDLAALAREVLDAIDLPEVMRQSSGAVSSQAAQVLRTEGMHADDSVARFVDRVLHRSPRADGGNRSSAALSAGPGGPPGPGLPVDVRVQVVHDDRPEDDVLHGAASGADPAPQQSDGQDHAGEGPEQRPDPAEPGLSGRPDPQAEQARAVGTARRGPGNGQVQDGEPQEDERRDHEPGVRPAEAQRGPGEPDARGAQVESQGEQDDDGSVHAGGQHAGDHAGVG